MTYKTGADSFGSQPSPGGDMPYMAIVALGTKVTPRPPRRSVPAELPHTAPASGVWRIEAFLRVRVCVADGRHLACRRVAIEGFGRRQEKQHGTEILCAELSNAAAGPLPAQGADNQRCNFAATTAAFPAPDFMTFFLTDRPPATLCAC